MGATAIQVTASGTVNYTIQQSLDDPTAYPQTVTAYGMTWVDHPDTNVVAATATKQANYAYPPQWARIVLNSGSGTATMTIRQTYLG